LFTFEYSTRGSTHEDETLFTLLRAILNTHALTARVFLHAISVIWCSSLMEIIR
jgi:hypothetical protein